MAPPTPELQLYGAAKENCTRAPATKYIRSPLSLAPGPSPKCPPQHHRHYLPRCCRGRETWYIFSRIVFGSEWRHVVVVVVVVGNSHNSSDVVSICRNLQRRRCRVVRLFLNKLRESRGEGRISRPNSRGRMCCAGSGCSGCAGLRVSMKNGDFICCIDLDYFWGLEIFVSDQLSDVDQCVRRVWR